MEALFLRVLKWKTAPSLLIYKADKSLSCWKTLSVCVASIQRYTKIADRLWPEKNPKQLLKKLVKGPEIVYTTHRAKWFKTDIGIRGSQIFFFSALVTIPIIVYSYLCVRLGYIWELASCHFQVKQTHDDMIHSEPLRTVRWAANKSEYLFALGL